MGPNFLSDWKGTKDSHGMQIVLWVFELLSQYLSIQMEPIHSEKGIK